MFISEYTSNSFDKSNLATLSYLKKRTRKKRNAKKITALARYTKDAGANINFVWGVMSCTYAVVGNTVTTDFPPLSSYDVLDCHICSQAKQHQTILWEEKPSNAGALTLSAFNHCVESNDQEGQEQFTENWRNQTLPSVLLLHFRTMLWTNLENLLSP